MTRSFWYYSRIWNWFTLFYMIKILWWIWAGTRFVSYEDSIEASLL